jgi:hypothetical protein
VFHDSWFVPGCFVLICYRRPFTSTHATDSPLDSSELKPRTLIFARAPVAEQLDFGRTRLALSGYDRLSEQKYVTAQYWRQNAAHSDARQREQLPEWQAEQQESKNHKNDACGLNAEALSNRRD